MKMHSARYTAGRRFISAQGDIYAIKELLGHEDIATTATIYVQGNEASLGRELRSVYEPGSADNHSADPPSSPTVPPTPRENPRKTGVRWRRRESNPRPRPYRAERLQA